MSCEGPDCNAPPAIVCDAGLCRKCGMCRSTVSMSPDGTYVVCCPECKDTFRIQVTRTIGEAKATFKVV